MNITIVLNKLLPVVNYGGTERVMWYLGMELAKKHHKVYFLCKPGSQCPFAECVPYDSTEDIESQIPADTDIIHFNNGTNGYSGEKPYIVTYHGNENPNIDKNAVFVSKDHATRHGSGSYVYNGLNWDDYGELDTYASRSYFHFLGNAAWHVKNVTGAIDVVKKLPCERLYVLGGNRLNFKMGFRLTVTPKACFKGMVGGKKKIDYLWHSKGLIFPVMWHEPFGLAITESLYCGAPIFGTPYGSLKELVVPDVGFLTQNKDEMVRHIHDDYHYNPIRCHEYARDLFNSRLMAEEYLKKYDRILNGEILNTNTLQHYSLPIEEKKLMRQNWNNRIHL